MEYSLGLLALWLLIFMPLGVAFHWLVLGASARVQAAPLAPVTGISLGILVIGALAQLGAPPGALPVAVALFAAAALAAVAQWRRGTSWRSRSLYGAFAMLLVSAVALHAAATGTGGSAPLGSESGAATYRQVATIESWSGGPRARSSQVRHAAKDALRRFTGFEQLAGFTVAAGTSSSSSRQQEPAADGSTVTWTAYSLHPLMTALLAALAACPLFVLGRWCGLRWPGMVGSTLLGVLSAPALLAIALGNGAATAIIPLSLACTTALLLARRDRGWYAIAVVCGGALIACVGPLGLLPTALIAGSWAALGRRAHEHLAHTDVPVSARRSVAGAVGSATVALAAVARPLVHHAGGEMEALHSSLRDALAGWPATWLSPALDVTSPRLPADFLLLVITVALVGMVLAHSFVRGERRERAIAVGTVVMLAIGALVALSSPSNGIPLVDLGWLACGPVLAVAALRCASDLRAIASDTPGQRLATVGALAIISSAIVASAAAAVTTGTRTDGLRAPTTSLIVADETRTKGGVIVLTRNPWVAYHLGASAIALGGDRSVDVDELTRDNPLTKHSLLEHAYPAIVLNNDPLASDPPSTFRRDYSGDLAGLRVFVGQEGAAHPRPLRHDPVERIAPGSTPGATTIGGALLPGVALTDCERGSASMTCVPPTVNRVGACTDADIDAARSELDTTTGSTAAWARDASQPTARPMLSAACFQVPLDRTATSLRVHVRDVGIILTPQDATLRPRSAFTVRGIADPSARLVTSDTWAATSRRNASILYGDSRMVGTFDLLLEGRFGSGISLGVAGGTDSPFAAEVDSTLDGFTPRRSGTSLAGAITATDTTGTHVRFGRVFARPAPSTDACDIVLPLGSRQPRELQIKQAASAGTGESYAIPGIVATVTDVRRNGDSPIASVVVSSYLQQAGRPRYLLVDWIEQFRSMAGPSPCDGWISVPDVVPHAAEPGR